MVILLSFLFNVTDPFNFDTPYPDDVVSGAKHSSGVKLEGAFSDYASKYLISS